MISKKVPKNSNLQTIIGMRIQQTNTKTNQKSLSLSTSRQVPSSSYASIGAIDPSVSDESRKEWLKNIKNAKYMDDDFFSSNTKFKYQKFDDKNFNADKPLPKTEVIIKPEKPKLDYTRLDVSSEFNNL